MSLLELFEHNQAMLGLFPAMNLQLKICTNTYKQTTPTHNKQRLYKHPLNSSLSKYVSTEDKKRLKLRTLFQHVFKKVAGIYLVLRCWLQRFNYMTDLEQKISVDRSLGINYCGCTRSRMVIMYEIFTKLFHDIDVLNSGSSLRRK